MSSYIIYKDNMTTKQQKELSEFIEIMKKEKRAERTLKAYNERYEMMIRSGLFNKPISKTGDKKIIERIQKITDNLNTQIALISLATLLKRHIKGVESELLQNTMMEWSVKIKKKSFEKKQEKIEGGLPTREELLVDLEELYKKQDWKAYIVNWLFMYKFVRNLDLDLIITTDKEVINDNDNFLYYNGKKVKYIRNNYKTVKTYGSKTDKITDDKFINAVKEYLGMVRRQRYLLENRRTGDRVSKVSRNKYIYRLSLRSLGEVNLFKINVLSLKDDPNKLKKMSHSRGTALDTIYSEYNIDVNVEGNT